MTLLSIVNSAQRKLRLPVSSSVVASTDPNALTLWQLAIETGEQLALDYKWQELTREHTWTATATEVQADGLPADFGRIIPETFYNRSRTRHVNGPLTSQEWQVEKSLVSSSVVDAFYIRDSQMLITPTPTAGETYAYEYETDYWCETQDGTAQQEFQADSDVARLPDILFVLGLEWRFRAERGLEYATNLARFEKAIRDRAISTGGRRVISIAGGRPVGSMGAIVQDGNWPLT